LIGSAEFRRGFTAKRRKYAEEVEEEVAKMTRLQTSHHGVLRARKRFTGERDMNISKEDCGAPCAEVPAEPQT
jgi:hypothetical protein